MRSPKVKFKIAIHGKGDCNHPVTEPAANSKICSGFLRPFVAGIPNSPSIAAKRKMSLPVSARCGHYEFAENERKSHTLSTKRTVRSAPTGSQPQLHSLSGKPNRSPFLLCINLFLLCRNFRIKSDAQNCFTLSRSMPLPVSNLFASLSTPPLPSKPIAHAKDPHRHKLLVSMGILHIMRNFRISGP